VKRLAARRVLPDLSRQTSDHKGLARRLQVVAGILLDPDHRVLITERPDGGPFPGMWEFPGGKIKAGELPPSALIRELSEELGITARKVESFMCLDHNYADLAVRLHFFKVTEWYGEALGIEGQKLRWLMPAQIEKRLMLPADVPVIDALANGDQKRDVVAGLDGTAADT